MSCIEKITVNAKAVNWLKEKYPELCINAGLCERIGGRLYTKTFIDQSAPLPTQEPFTPDWDAMAVMVEEMQRMAKRIEELEEALAQPEQEPVGEVRDSSAYFYNGMYTDTVDAPDGTKLYTTPPQREWVGLTGFEQKEFMAMTAREAVFATEAKLKEKNNG